METVTLYVTKQFVKGTLRGLSYQDSIEFDCRYSALEFALEHAEVPVRAIGGSDYLITDYVLKYRA